MATGRSLQANIILTGEEQLRMGELLAGLNANPYVEPVLFCEQVGELCLSGDLPPRLLESCDKWREAAHSHSPIFFVRNAPVDAALPLLDLDAPVQTKRERKKTFIAESFIQAVATLLGLEIITYSNDNDGDLFHDVHPMIALANSHSQKSVRPLGFHSDGAAHFARPDYFNLLAVRAAEENRVYTTFVDLHDLLATLDPRLLQTLGEELYYTPQDDLTIYGERCGRFRGARPHPVVQDRSRVIYVEGRTVSTSKKGAEALALFTAELHRVKVSQFLAVGDAVFVDNNVCLHGRDIHRVEDPSALWHRWLIKSYGVREISDFERWFLPGRYRVING